MYRRRASVRRSDGGIRERGQTGESCGGLRRQNNKPSTRRRENRTVEKRKPKWSNVRAFILLVLTILCSLCCLTACAIADGGSEKPMFKVSLSQKNTVTAEEVTGDASGVSEVKVGDLRVQLLSDTVLRIEERAQSGKFENRPSYLVPDRGGWEPAVFEVREDENVTQIFVKDAESSDVAYVVHIPAGSSSAASVYVTDEEGEPLWHFA